ncbi:cytochrome c [Ramlibacter sp. PS3R-8]|uniref:c-type cytochrome n=1 Tax=Ramlibacter sp. PS3R-8 TaxID=3133437 RepID=UPI0030A7177B
MRRGTRILLGLGALGVVAGGAALLWDYQPWNKLQVAAPSAAPRNDVISRGEYLARVGDCVACHTAPGGREFAGLRQMATPFGSIYAPNVTPDDETGIGTWTADDFYRMMHTGRSKKGEVLYPAMPYANYTKVTREDSDAIYAYLMSVPPVKQPNRPHELRFPFNQRELLVGWRTLYFKQGVYEADTKQSKEWNRGAYLVQGLGHCSMCHTAVSALGGSRDQQAFSGGMIPNQNWYAPSLTSNREAGLGEWDIKDITDLLQAGASKRATVYGPMAEVTFHSLQYINDEDARAMAVYLKSLPPKNEPLPTPQAQMVAPGTMESGRRIYAKQCAMCHGDEGKGYPPAFPPLANNQSIEMASPVNAVRMILNGGYAPATHRNPRPYGMPPFAHLLNDEEIAAVATYVRVAWGNGGTPVTPAQANALRSVTQE